MQEPPDDDPGIDTLAGSVSEASDALKARTPAEGTYLPMLVVEAQTALAELSSYEVTKRLADLVVHAALRRGLGTSPRVLLADLLESYPISDESWHEKVGPELRRVLAGAGHVYGLPEQTVMNLPCESCGTLTTGDYTWDWPQRRMVVCSVCHPNQPVEPPS